MQKSPTSIILSPTDLANHLACRHLSWLNYHALHGGPKPSKNDDELADILRQYGEQHEQKYLDELRAKVAELGQGVINLDAERSDTDPYAVETLRDRAQQTKAALAAGGNVLYQPTFFREDDNGIAWVGRADFLVPVDSLTFEPEDTKLARIAKVNAILQLCSYAEHLGKIQDKDPEYIHVVTGSVEEGKVSVRLDEVSAYYRRIKDDLERAVLDGFTGSSEPIPVDFCTICRWNKDCNRTWREMDHLSFVAGLTNAHRETLVEAGVTTLAELATSSDDLVIDDLDVDTLRKLQAQARLQLDARTRKENDPSALPGYEYLLPTREWRGFNLLPEPNPGDLFYDIEGHPYRGDEGLEYLHGFAWTNPDGSSDYKAIWAHSPQEERAALIELVEFITNRRKQQGFENMRVYHFGHYEPTTLTRLAARHGACETELAALLRERVFVDLSKVVTQSMRIGVESYSIKKLEQLYAFDRTDLVADGGLSIVYYERWLQSVGTEEFGDTGDTAVLEDLEKYNMNDCLSTIALRAWLEERRAEVVARIANDPELGFLVRPLLNPNTAPDADSKGELIDALNLHRFEVDLTEETIAENTHRWLMADLLEFHKREKAVDNYEWAAAISMDDQQFIDDTKAIGGLELVADHGAEEASARTEYSFKTKRTYRFDPRQLTDVSSGDGFESPAFHPYRDDPAETGAVARATVNSIDLENGILELSILSHDNPAPAITSGFGTNFIKKEAFESALVDIAHSVRGDSSDFAPAAHDMLRLRPPRFRDGFDLAAVSSVASPLPEDIAEAIHHLDKSYLVIQGPPGTGKTYSSAHAILQLIDKGHRVGITSNTHAAVHQLLSEIALHAPDYGYSKDKQLKVGLKVNSADHAPNLTGDSIALSAVTDNRRMISKAKTFDIVGGTSFLFANADMRDSVTTLVIDEAGQLSFADTLAVSMAAQNVVLVGDPQQLKQPTRAAHPGTSGLSGLEHINQGHDVVPREYGILLGVTRRMHPSITSFISEQVYEGKLGSAEECLRQTIGEGGLVSGHGLRWLPIEHHGCASRSTEEATAIVKIYESLLGKSFTDKHGVTRPIEPKDIFVIAPYNAQVRELRQRIRSSAAVKEIGISDELLRSRVGTVDKAQGAEAPVVLVSYTSSSAADIPRNFEFLYDKNRLNVAVSRAQALAVVVASPALLSVECKTIEQVKLANMLCRFAECAQLIAL